VLTIDRPEAANSIDLATARALSVAFDQLSDDNDVRVVVITGAGHRVFCAGMDLRAVQAGEADAINGVPGGFGGLVRRHFPHPVVAAVNGAAVGGGFELVLACDLIVAAENASFGLPEVRRGLIAASGGLVRIARRVSPVVASELALTGASITALEAQRLGLVNEVVPTGQALDAASALAGRIALNAPMALRATKKLLRASLDASEDELWRLNSVLSAEMQASEDAAEGAAAFSEKREPRWQNR
jgi:enoyl-CoA hydratase/carnithine racemase